MICMRRELVWLLERKYNMDIGKLRKEILMPENIAAIKLGAKCIKCGDVRYAIKGSTVVTALDKGIATKK